MQMVQGKIVKKTPGLDALRCGNCVKKCDMNYYCNEAERVMPELGWLTTRNEIHIDSIQS